MNKINTNLRDNKKSKFEKLKLKEIFQISNIGADKKIQKEEKLVNLLNFMDVYKRKVYTNMKTSVPINRYEDIKVLKGDLFITPSSETAQDIMNAFYINNELHEYVYSYHIVRLRKKIKVNVKFIEFLLNSKKHRKNFSKLANGAQRFTLSKSDIENYEIIIPTLNMQYKFADLLSSIDILIESQEKYISKLWERKNFFTKEIFTQKLRFKGFNEKWGKNKLNNLVKVKSSNITDKELNIQGEYPVYGASGIKGYIDYYMFKEEKIAIVKDGSGVGRLFICKKRSSIISTLNYFDSFDINTRFLFYSLNKINFSIYKVGSSIPHIYFKDYGNENIFIPSLEEQNNITNLLSSMDKLIELNEEKLENLKKKKKYYLNEIFK